MSEEMFNEYQRDYMRSLDETHPSKLCYCGWHRVGDCSTYPAGDKRTSLDKLHDWLEKPCVCPKYCEHCQAEKALAYWKEVDATASARERNEMRRKQDSKT